MNLNIQKLLVLILSSLGYTGCLQSKEKQIENDPNLVQFEGCGKKDSTGAWVEFYNNCQGFDGATFYKAPPCRKDFVKVKEAVPKHLVSDLEQCIYEL